MTEREEQIRDRTDVRRLAWVRPELRRLEAGKAEVGGGPGPDVAVLS